jgi:tetratricopeptide (TPR) repeat protein
MWLLILAALAVLPATAESKWTFVRSANFELYSTAGPKEARKTIEAFEQIRDFFLQNRSAPPFKIPVTIIAFKNRKEYAPYSARDTSAAYYQSTELRDFIVMSGTGVDQFPVAVHEYIHLLVRHSELKLPVWLNEGMAEVYSTIQPFGGNIVLGAVPKGRAYALGQSKWLPIGKLTSVNHDSAEYNEKDRVGLFYSQSWLLAHMLMLDPLLRPEFPKFLGAVAGGKSTDEAFRVAYDLTPAEIEKRLGAYYRSDSLMGVRFDTKFQKMETSEPEAADPVAVEVATASLLSAIQRHDDAAARFKSLIATYPDRHEVHAAAGQAAWARRDREAARTSLLRATELEAPDWRTWWTCARVLQGDSEKQQQLITVLRGALRRNSALTDARLMLGSELYRAKQYKDALDVLGTIRNITPDRAPSLFLTIAYSAMHLGLDEEARKAAEQARKHSKEMVDVSAAEQVFRYLDAKQQVAQSAPVIEGRPPRPVQVRAPAETAPEPEAPKPPVLMSLRGALEHVDCKGEQALLRVRSGGAVTLFLIPRPDAVTIKNAPGTSVNLNCGPQTKPAPISIEYTDRADKARGTAGDVVLLEFTAQ